MLGKLDSHLQKNETRTFSHTTYKIKLKMYQRPNYKTWNHKTHRRQHRQHTPRHWSYQFFFWFFFLNFILFYFLYSRFLLVINFVHISVYMSIPVSQFIPPPTSPLGVHMFVLYVCVSTSTLQISSSIPFFLDSTHMR